MMQHGSWSTLVQVMACCLTSSSHYLNQCWLIRKKRLVAFIWGQFSLVFVNTLWFNSLRPSDAIWLQRSQSPLAQVMACCLTAPSHYLNQCWLLSSQILWHLSEVNSIQCLLTHWGRDKMAAIYQTTFTNAFPWMKMYEFRLKFHWSLFVRVQLTIYQHWFW